MVSIVLSIVFLAELAISSNFVRSKVFTSRSECDILSLGVFKMANVYDVIDILREGKYLSMRRLAALTGISSTTMASVMKRKPKDVSVEFLQKVAKAFGIHWHEFYGCEPEIYNKYNDERVSSFVTEKAKDDFLYRMLGSTYQEMNDLKNTEAYHAVEQVLNKHGLSSENMSRENAFYAGILALLKELNSEGVKEVLARTLEVAKDENYRKKD